MKLAIAQLNPVVGNLNGNADRIISAIHEARQKGCELVLFSELAICGYPPEDLLLMHEFIAEIDRQLQRVIHASTGIAVVVGTVRREGSGKETAIYNSAAIIEDGQLRGYYDKNLLPTYDVFDERRYFTPGIDCPIWNLRGKKIGITICEDIWEHGQLIPANYQSDPVCNLSLHSPDIALNLSASPYSYHKPEMRLHTVQTAARSLGCTFAICNQVGANDSLIFDGYSCVVDNKGELLCRARGFDEELLIVDLDLQRAPPHPRNMIEDLYRSLVLGVRDYFQKTGNKKACLGLSGGIDSALVACIAVDALGNDNVLGVAMPSRFSSPESFHDAKKLAETLHIGFTEFSIEGPFKSYLELLSCPSNEGLFGLTEENLQARIRGMLLMAISNRDGCLVLSTGNKSEAAMGYSTLYGDMCGALSVIGDIYKTQVYELAHWLNREQEIIPRDILRKPPSAELRHNQKDSDTLPDYEVLDAILDDFIEKGLCPEKIAASRALSAVLVSETVQKVLRNEYKRRQMPTVLRVSEKGLTPSAGRRVPIVHGWQF